MDSKIVFFFERHLDALPIYEALERRIFSEIENATVKVQKSQISFYNRHLFACVSFANVRKKPDRPKDFIVLTLGLDHRLESARIDVATEPYPNRWTHHILLSRAAEIDDELMGWIKEASAFSAGKR
ncbi:MAG: hypothetical protein HFG26_09830 [Provencibacterium sp.]|jgi:hypothetical protein|nr:hypothetical protein [Provencibacterium sp.]